MFSISVVIVKKWIQYKMKLSSFLNCFLFFAPSLDSYSSSLCAQFFSINPDKHRYLITVRDHNNPSNFACLKWCKKFCLRSLALTVTINKMKLSWLAKHVVGQSTFCVFCTACLYTYVRINVECHRSIVLVYETFCILNQKQALVHAFSKSLIYSIIMNLNQHLM